MKSSSETLLPTALGIVAIIAIIFFIRTIEAEENMADKTTAASTEVTATTVKADSSSPFIEFPDPALTQGREIWLDSCKGCHADGTAGAPIPMEKEAWEFRIQKGKPVLYEHAIKGFFGPDDTMMPERGGNPKLTDDEVKAAVDYMVALAEHYIKNP